MNKVDGAFADLGQKRPANGSGTGILLLRHGGRKCQESLDTLWESIAVHLDLVLQTEISNLDQECQETAVPAREFLCIKDNALDPRLGFNLLPHLVGRGQFLPNFPVPRKLNKQSILSRTAEVQSALVRH